MTGTGSRRRAAGAGEKRARSGQGRAGLPPAGPAAAAGAGPNWRGYPPMRGGGGARGPAAGAPRPGGAGRPRAVPNARGTPAAGAGGGGRGRGGGQAALAWKSPGRLCTCKHDAVGGGGQAALAWKSQRRRTAGRRRARLRFHGIGGPARRQLPGPGPRRAAPRAGRADRGRPRGRGMRVGLCGVHHDPGRAAGARVQQGPCGRATPRRGESGGLVQSGACNARCGVVSVYDGLIASLSVLDILLSNVASLVMPSFFST